MNEALEKDGRAQTDDELKWRKDISEALARIASSQERIAWILETIEKRIV